MGNRIELPGLVDATVEELENQFLTLKNICEDLKIHYPTNDDETQTVYILVPL